MTDPEFYRRDRPDDTPLQEDRPRGGGPEDADTKHSSRFLWVLIAIVFVVVALLLVFILP